MEIGTNTIDDLDFYEDEIDGDGNFTGNRYDPMEEKEMVDTTQYEEEEEPNEVDQPTYEAPDSSDVIAQLLRDKGIMDSSKIKFADENDEIQEKDWDSLTPEEQYNILSTPNESSNVDLNDDEINLINTLRENNFTSEQLAQAIGEQAVRAYIQQQGNPEPTYEVDSISDDDLYVIDLAARVPDITDEELIKSLEDAKQNPDLFQKQMSGIRQEYKDLEQQNLDEQRAIAEQQAQERYQQFSDAIVDSINGLTDIGGLEIELNNDDKQELADFILGQDQAGINYLNKALNDPDTLTRMAWFALKGQETLDSIVEYFTKEITKVRNSAYQEGLKANQKKPSVVVSKKNQAKQFTTTNTNNAIDIHDLNVFDD